MRKAGEIATERLALAEEHGDEASIAQAEHLLARVSGCSRASWSSAAVAWTGSGGCWNRCRSQRQFFFGSDPTFER
jgi:hypothetical protein